MTDPVAALSLATIGSLALSEGVKFFYAQAGELLKWWRDKHSSAGTGGESAAPQEVRVAPPQTITGGDFTATLNSVAVERFEQDIRALRKELSEYGDAGTEPVDAFDPALLGRIDGLRRILEVVYQRPLTFVGENRNEPDPTLDASIDIERVAGYVAGVRAAEINSGRVAARLRIKDAAPGAQVVGVDVDRVG
jgi:hypothetical protein